MTRPPLARTVAAELAFRARLAELGVTLLEPEWLGSKTRHRAICAAGHDCMVRPNNLQQGDGPCRRCRSAELARPRALLAEAAFRAHLATIGAELLGPYTGNKHPARVRCAAGHECWPRWNDVQGGKGICRMCANQDPAMAEAAFRATLARLGAELRESTWLGAMCPHRAICTAGHECWPKPNSVQQGQGICRVCAGQIWDAFYVVTTAAADRLKFGITSGAGRPRLQVHQAAGYRTVARLRTGLPGTVAPDTEQAVKAALALAGVRPVRGREYFDGSALALVLDVADAWLGPPPL